MADLIRHIIARVLHRPIRLHPDGDRIHDDKERAAELEGKVLEHARGVLPDQGHVLQYSRAHHIPI